MNLSFSDAACTQAIVSAGGVAAIVAAIVAAMRQHTADAEAQRNGCGALANLAFDVAVFKQAIVDAGGVAAAVLAMRDCMRRMRCCSASEAAR